MADDADARSRAKSLPAPRTIAPSREDVLSNLAFFFGDPVVPERLRDYSEHHAMTFHFPDAYHGQNTKIRETLNNLILKAPQEWHTQVALPFVKIVGTTVEWDEIRFDVRLMQRVPYEGISRMSTSLRRRHRDRVVRRGIGLTIESDFYATEAGRSHFADQLTSIRYCVQETCNFDAIFAYLSCGNYDFRYDIQKGLRPRRSVRTAMAHEINLFAIVQKDQMGLDKAIEETKFRMSRYSVTPNMLIIPPQLALYLSLAPEQKLTYPLGGPAAQAAFEAGLKGFEAKSFRGLGVFTSTPYEVSDDQDSVQMLQRSSQVGEFYRCNPPTILPSDNRPPVGFMDIMIYNEESDRHVHIPFIEAYRATCVGPSVAGGAAQYVGVEVFGLANIASGEAAKFDASYTAFSTWVKAADSVYTRVDGYPLDKADHNGGLFDLSDTGTAELTTGGTVYAEFQDAGTRLTGWRKLAALAAFAHAVDAGDRGGGTEPARIYRGLVCLLVNLVKHQCYVPISITIARPFIEHLMMSAVVTVAGRDTGATLFGPADMQISANTSVKTIEGHYTCHTKSVITKPQNVCVMRDIMCSGYVAGCNTIWFGSDKNQAGGPHDASVVRENMEQRLSFSDDAQGEYASMLAFGSPAHEGEHRDQVISITDRLLPWEVTKAGSAKNYFPGGQENFRAYSPAYGLGEIHFGEDVRASENMEFISQGSLNNGLCFVGPHRTYNPIAANYHQLIPGQGHFGPDAIPGDARWRRGEAISLKASRDSMVSLEVAAHAQMYMGLKKV